MDWKGKRVLVTGGTGFIGSVFVEKLLERGAKLRVPVRSQNYRALSRLRSKIEWIDGDLRDPQYCSQILTGIDHLFHLAAHRRNVEFHHSHCCDVLLGNVQMSHALIQGLKDVTQQVAVTFFSTANVPPAIDVIALAQDLKLVDGYILGKALCEALWFSAANQYAFPLLIVRPVGVYGERDTFSEDGNVIPSLMVKARFAKDKLLVWGTGRQERAFMYVEDLVNATLRLQDAGAQGIQYVIPPDVVTVKYLAEQIRDLVQPGLPIEFDPTKPKGTRAQPRLPIHESLKAFKWTPFKVGLKKTYEGWKNQAKK